MKIPKKDGTTVLKGNDSTDNWEDILCDKCGKSTRDDCNMNFEYMQMEGLWGYGSIDKDGQYHEAQVCEPCYDGLGIKPLIKELLFTHGTLCSCENSNNPVKKLPCEVHYNSTKGTNP